MAYPKEFWRLSLAFLLIITITNAKSKSSVIDLSEDNWSDMLNGEWLVKFYAPWCPACKALDTTWQKVAGWSQDLEVNVAQIDVTDNPGLSGRFMVTSLPTIYHVKDGAIRVYRGSRTEDDLVSFVDDKKYTKVDPLPWYISPSSLHMGALGMFFKVSMGIRDVHNKMTSDYGIPVWGSYTMFAFMTIFAGLILGLVIVFLCDVVFPPKPPPRPQPKSQYDSIRPFQRPEDDKDNESDILDDRPVKHDDSRSSGDNGSSVDRATEEDSSSAQARKRKPRTTAD